MIEINLLPPELRKKEVTRFALPNILNRQFMIRSLLVFAGVHVLLGGLVAVQTLYHGHLKREVAALKTSSQEIIRQKSEIKTGKERMSRLGQMTQRNFSWTRLLNALSNGVPKGLWLRSFKVTEEMRALPQQDAKAAKSKSSETSPKTKEEKKKKEKPKQEKEEKVNALKLEGSVVGNGQETATISRFIKALKEDPYFGSLFDEIEFFNITQRKIKSFDVYDFTIVCVFKKGKF